MDHYELGEITVTEPNLFEKLNLPLTNIQMNVKDHSIPKNIIRFAMRKIERDDIETVVWLGAEPEAETILYCAETMWERHQKLHFLMRTGVRREEEMWTAKDNPSLTGLKVKREMTYIGVLLSKYLLPGTDSEEGYKPCRADMPVSHKQHYQQRRNQHQSQQYHSKKPHPTSKSQHYGYKRHTDQSRKQHRQQTDTDTHHEHQNGDREPHNSHSQPQMTHNGNSSHSGRQYRKPRQHAMRNMSEKPKDTRDKSSKQIRNGGTTDLSQIA